MATEADSGRMQAVVREILVEVERATRKFPTWPSDPMHRSNPPASHDGSAVSIGDVVQTIYGRGVVVSKLGDMFVEFEDGSGCALHEIREA